MIIIIIVAGLASLGLLLALIYYTKKIMKNRKEQ